MSDGRFANPQPLLDLSMQPLIAPKLARTVKSCSCSSGSVCLQPSAGGRYRCARL